MSVKDDFKDAVETVLCYLELEGKYLMLYRNKRKNDYNKGKWIGVGGHIKNGETIEEALFREVKEETNLDLYDYNLCATLYFLCDNYKEKIYLFKSSFFSGKLKECNEGELKYIDKDKILDLPIFEGDRYFISRLESNEYFELFIHYEKDKLKEVIEL